MCGKVEVRVLYSDKSGGFGLDIEYFAPRARMYFLSAVVAENNLIFEM